VLSGIRGGTERHETMSSASYERVRVD